MHIWEKVLDLPESHRYFRTQDPHTGLWSYALADRSGTDPDSTDDGVLWLDFGRSLDVQLSSSDRCVVTIPLKRADGSPSATLDAAYNAPTLIKFWRSLGGRVTLDAMTRSIVAEVDRSCES